MSRLIVTWSRGALCTPRIVLPLSRPLSSSVDIEKIFIDNSVQKLLKDITRFEEEKIFARRTVDRLSSPKFAFMSDDQLARAKQDAYDKVRSRLQMPPVMKPDNSEPKVLCKEDHIVGYTKFKIMFVDISHGFTNRNRLMSVRETDGTLRLPSHEERSRLNHMFYPMETRTIDVPKMFEEGNLKKMLDRGQSIYILNRACVQFEPDDPRYVNIVNQVYDYIDHKSQFDTLRSTRHFGPMSLYLAYNNRIDNLLLEMLGKKYIEDAAKLVKLFNICHEIKSEKEEDLDILREYSDHHSVVKHKVGLAIQELDNLKEGSDNMNG